MPTERLTLNIDSSGIIEELRNMAVPAGYEVTLPGGNVLLYGLNDEAVVATFVEQLGQDAVEPVYKFGKPKPTPSHPDLFESEQP